jgi:GPH family glycoside/pentoside/hexuronide:cation symporter
VLLISIIPAVFAFAAAGVMLFYKLDNRQMARIQKELVERKASNALVPVDQH